MPGADLLPVPPLEGGLRHRQGPRGAPATESLAAICQGVEGWFFVGKPTVKTCEIPRNIRKMMKNWGFPTPKQISSGQTLPRFWAKYGCPPLAIQFLRIVSERIDRY